MNKKITTLSIVSLLIFQSSASTLYIENHSSIVMSVVIEPRGEGIDLGEPIIIKQINPDENIVMRLDASDINDAEMYAISAKVQHRFSPYNHCYPLFIEQNYKIIFKENNALGVVCLFESGRWPE